MCVKKLKFKENLQDKTSQKGATYKTRIKMKVIKNEVTELWKDTVVCRIC
jgi:hypothetical protein